MQYAVNAVANAILVQRLSKSGKVNRFVLVSSEAHRWAKPDIDASLHGLKNPPPYSATSAMEQYSRYAEQTTASSPFTRMRRSKLLVMSWMCGASRAFRHDPSLRRVELAAMCPGAVATNIARNAPYCAALVTRIMKLFFPSPYTAAAPVVWMALADDLSAPAGQPIYYQHLWQQVQPPAARHFASRSTAATETPFGARHGCRIKRSSLCRYELYHR
jgi:hypothetical protein